VSYELLWRPKGVVKRFHGQVTGAEVLRSIEEVEGDYRFDELHYVVDDFLDIDGISASSDDIEVFAAIDRSAARVNPRIKIAIVATEPKVVELARQYANSPLNAYPTRIFATRGEADAWLG
jgi:hypothetical protein